MDFKYCSACARKLQLLSFRARTPSRSRYQGLQHLYCLPREGEDSRRRTNPYAGPPSQKPRRLPPVLLPTLRPRSQPPRATSHPSFQFAAAPSSVCPSSLTTATRATSHPSFQFIAASSAARPASPSTRVRPSSSSATPSEPRILACRLKPSSRQAPLITPQPPRNADPPPRPVPPWRPPRSTHLTSGRICGGSTLPWPTLKWKRVAAAGSAGSPWT